MLIDKQPHHSLLNGEVCFIIHLNGVGNAFSNNEL